MIVDMSVNVKKSICMRIGPRHSSSCYFSETSCKIDTSTSCCKFFGNFNNIVAIAGRAK